MFAPNLINVALMLLVWSFAASQVIAQDEKAEASGLSITWEKNYLTTSQSNREAKIDQWPVV